MSCGLPFSATFSTNPLALSTRACFASALAFHFFFSVFKNEFRFSKNASKWERNSFHISWLMFFATGPAFFHSSCRFLNFCVLDSQDLASSGSMDPNSLAFSKLPFFINSKYHYYHHSIGKGNYSIFFPLWDNYMKTRIKKSKKKKKAKN